MYFQPLEANSNGLENEGPPPTWRNSEQVRQVLVQLKYSWTDNATGSARYGTLPSEPSEHNDCRSPYRKAPFQLTP
jgi:hypothetical protein